MEYTVTILESVADEQLRFLEICLKRQEYTLNTMKRDNPLTIGKGLTRYLVQEQLAFQKVCRRIKAEMAYLEERIEYFKHAIHTTALTRRL